MSSMIDLEIAVINHDHDVVKSLMSDLDRRTELAMFKKAADHFGFKLLEHRGRGFAMRRELAPIFGYIGESGLRMLCERYDLETVSLGTFAQDVRMLVIEKMDLHPNDGKTVFVNWDTFLIAGMESQNEAARKVKAYLLQMERAGRIAGGALDLANSRTLRINHADKITRIAARVDRINDQQLKTQLGIYLNEVLDDALDITKQLDLFNQPPKPD